MADIACAAGLFLPPFLGDGGDSDEDLEILHDPCPFWSPFLDSHRDLDDAHSEIDPDVFIPIFSSDLTPKAPSFAATAFDLPSGTDSEVDVETDLTLDLVDRCFHSEIGVMETGDLDGIRMGSSVYVELADGEGENHRILGEDFDAGDTGVDADIPMYWDCLRIEDVRRDLNEEFEWEEVNGLAFEREDLRLSEEVSQVEIGSGSDAGGEEEVPARNTEWEVLLTVGNIDRNRSPEQEDAEPYLGDERDDGYVYTAEYDVLFGQFVDHNSFIKGTPPAARSVVENLPSIFLAKEKGDSARENVVCAVCRDDIAMDESVKQLPCMHHYHRDCILPWLAVRNTCPVCRYELPTDDAEYETWKARRVNGGRNHQEEAEEEELRAGYAFEILPED